MPYKCTVCGVAYKEGSPELKEVMKAGGCKCGKKFLMYVPLRKKEVEEEPPQDTSKIEEPKVKEKKSISDADMEWLGTKLVKMRETDQPLCLGIETIRVIEEGKYEVDVASLMGGNPLIIKAEDGVYFIDLPYSMKKK